EAAAGDGDDRGAGTELRSRTGAREQPADPGRRGRDVKDGRKALRRLLDTLLERLREVAARAKDQCLDGRVREAHRLRDLGVAEALPLGEEDRGAKVLRHAREGVVQTHQVLALSLARGRPLLDQLEVLRSLDARAPRRREPPREADVVRNLVEPGR